MVSPLLKDDLLSWKQEYGDVFSITVNGQIYVWRSITFREFDDITDALDDDSSSIDIEDGLVRTGVLWPEAFDPDRHQPGLVTMLAQNIREASCLDGDVYHARELLEESRRKLSGYRGEMNSFILFAMPQYRMEELAEITFRELSELVAMAEKVIYLRQISEGIQVDRPIRFEMYTEEELAELGSAKISDHGNATVSDPIAQKLMEAM